MGIEEVTGGLMIVAGAVYVTRALPSLARAGRNEARYAAVPAEAWSGLCAGLGFWAGGVLYLLDPGYSHGSLLAGIPFVLAAASVILVTIPRIVSRMKAGRPGLSSADTPGLISAPEPDASAAGLIERIKHVQFGTTRVVPGYDEQEVDTFLDKLVAALSQDGRLDRSELRDVQFSTTRLRPGYQMPDVDSFLEEVAQATW